MALSKHLTEADLTGILELFDSTDFGLAIVDADGILQGVNNRLASIFGYESTELLEQPAEVFWQGFRQQHQYHLFFLHLADRQDWQGELLCKSRQGKIFPVRINWLFHPKNPNIAIGIFNDLTSQKRWESKILEAKDSAERYLDISQAMIVSLNTEGEILEINRRGCEILDHSDPEDLIGKNWFDIAIPSHCKRQELLLNQHILNRDELPPNSIEGEVITDKGETRFILWNHSLTVNEHDEVIGTLSSGQDISMRKAAEQEIYRLAMTDHLTGLLNRRSFYHRFEESLKLAQRNHLVIACITIDLDRFKPINDTYGHAMGDKVLIHVSEILNQNFRETDSIGRLGGDEFGVVAVLSGDHHLLKRALTRLLERLSEPMNIDDTEINIGASIGVSYYPNDADEMVDLLRKADEALYKAKNGGRNRVEAYSDDSSKNAS